MSVSAQRLPPPPMPLNLPEPPSDRERRGRPPSPLRNIRTVDPVTGEISEEGSFHTADNTNDDRASSIQSLSPAPSITKFAATFAQRVNTFVGGMAPVSPQGHMLTNAELEAEAEREREWSRREAEMILRREADERKMVEDGVMALLNNTDKDDAPLPPPPIRSRTMSNPPSPASSQKSQKDKDGNWFTAVKNKLTPSKEPLTPAQQIIQDTKAKEKEKKKNKDKDKQEWPVVPGSKDTDPGFLNLLASANKWSSGDPHTPPRPISQQNSFMTPSPKRSVDDSNDMQPMYAQLNAQGSLDVTATLLTVARRFEKLEKWTVSHVRALEDRMSDVERWLVEKEKEKGEAKSIQSGADDNDDDDRDNDIGDIRDELVELQGRMGELGREMAKMMTAQPNLQSAPGRQAGMFTSNPSIPITPSSAVPRSLPSIPPLATPQRTPSVQSQNRGKDISSPPSVHSPASRTRLPYPTGDYTSPTDERRDTPSPVASPPPSLNAAHKRPMSISGLPSSSGSFAYQLSSSSTSGLPKPSPPTVSAANSTKSTVNLVTPTAIRQSSMSPSPTPRKRYTVALGGPLTAPSSGDDEDPLDSPYRRSRYTASPASTPDVLTESNESSDVDDEGRQYGHKREDTVGKSEHRKSMGSTTSSDSLKRTNAIGTSRSKPVTPRARAQSAYGAITGSEALAASAPASVSPLKVRVRSQSTDRIGLGISTPSKGGSSKFIDPLVIRKQEKESSGPKTPKTPLFGRGKVPINQLVAFFDSDKR